MTTLAIQGAFEDAQQALKPLRKALAAAEERYRQLKPEMFRKHAWLFEYSTPIEEALSACRMLKVAIEKGLTVGRAAGRSATIPLPTTCALCGEAQGDDGRCPKGHTADESADRWREAIAKLLASKHREQGRKIGPKGF